MHEDDSLSLLQELYGKWSTELFQRIVKALLLTIRQKHAQCPVFLFFFTYILCNTLTSQCWC